MSLEIGAIVPDFALRSQHGEQIVLSELRGRPVAVVFFPFAFSGICTDELCEIRDNLALFDDEDVEVLAISCDAMFSLRAFADAEHLTFRVLSDHWPHGAVAELFGVFNADAGASERGTFLIDAEGRLAWKVHHSIGQARDMAAYREAVAGLTTPGPA